jgi:hypothetical protein
MSRGQQGTVFSTGASQNKNLNNLSNSSFNAAQTDLGQTEGDINSFGDELSQFKANNPYTAGGAFQTASNQEAADTSAATAERTGQMLQSAAVRGGQNPNAAIQATEDTAIAGQREQAGEEAEATKQRLGLDTGYGQEVLGATGQKEQMQQALTNEQAGIAGKEGELAEGALSEEEKAAQTPSFLDELGQGAINAGVAFAGGAGKAIGCWIAAACFDGWDDPRTIMVRGYIFGPFAQSWIGAKISQAYLRYGERIAARITHSSSLKWLMTKVCNIALKQAVKRG